MRRKACTDRVLRATSAPELRAALAELDELDESSSRQAIPALSEHLLHRDLELAVAARHAVATIRP